MNCKINGPIHQKNTIAKHRIQRTYRPFYRHFTGTQAIGIILINTYESGKSRLNGHFSGHYLGYDLRIFKNIDRVKVLSLSAGPYVRRSGPSPTRETQTGSHSFYMTIARATDAIIPSQGNRQDFPFLLWNNWMT